jgi:hypothetical protein
MLIKTIRQGGKINNKTGNIVCIENLTNHVIFLIVLVFPFQNQSKIEKSKNQKIEKLKNREKKTLKNFLSKILRIFPARTTGPFLFHPLIYFSIRPIIFPFIFNTNIEFD